MYIKIRYEFFAVSSEPPRIPSAQYYTVRTECSGRLGQCPLKGE